MPSIKFIAEGHGGLTDKIKRVDTEKDEIGQEVIALQVSQRFKK
jgi:hypothetical protein